MKLGDATHKMTQLMRHFGPFGIGNPAPVFVARAVRVSGTPREVGEGHVKVDLVQDSATLSAIGFGMAERLREVDHAQTAIDIAFQLQENYWNGRVELQMRLVDFRLTE